MEQQEPLRSGQPHFAGIGLQTAAQLREIRHGEEAQLEIQCAGLQPGDTLTFASDWGSDFVF